VRYLSINISRLLRTYPTSVSDWRFYINREKNRQLPSVPHRAAVKEVTVVRNLAGYFATQGRKRRIVWGGAFIQDLQSKKLVVYICQAFSKSVELGPASYDVA
jgi:hypothetical protein